MSEEEKITVSKQALAEVIDYVCDGCEARETPAIDEAKEIRDECPIAKFFPEFACNLEDVSAENSEDKGVS